MSIPLLLGVPAFLVALTLSLVLGLSWWRQLGLVTLGFAGWAIASALVLTAECPADAYECLPGLGVIFAAFALVGWLLGIGVGAGVRWLGGRP